MFAYYLHLGLRSLKRNKALTVLMVLTLGFGVAATMTTWSVFRAVSGDPIPWKSDKLFVPQVDNWGPDHNNDDDEPPDLMSYPDAIKLMQAHRARYQSAMYQISPSVVPSEPGRHPLQITGHAVYSEFFPMVDAPFQYGGPWTSEQDQRRAKVAVLGAELNRKLFGGENSIGKTIQVEASDYRIVGVLEEWNPQPRFYDIRNTGGFSTNGDQLFIPMTAAIAASIANNGTTNCTSQPEAGFDGLQRSECVWLAFLVQLDSAGQAAEYKRFLTAYAAEQQAAGRFDWEPNVRLRSVPEFLEFLGVVPRDTVVSLLVALGLLLVCLVNTAGLLLAKFLRRSPEIGVRRALGASKREIYIQYLIEASMVGLAGGALGLLLTGLGVAGISWVLPEEIASLARIDLPLLFLTLLVAVVAAALAGLYPTLHATQVQPAWQLKSN